MAMRLIILISIFYYAVQGTSTLLNSNPEESTGDHIDEERSARCALGSRRRLKTEDADQVARYFLTGGPITGLSHFNTISNPPCNAHNIDHSHLLIHSQPVVGTSKPEQCIKNPVSNPVISETNPTHGSYLVPPPIAHTPIYGNPYSPLHPITNPAYHHARTLPYIRPSDGLLGSILHPHSLLHGLHTLPYNLLRLAAPPTYGLPGVHPVLHGITNPVPPYQSSIGRSSSNAESETSAKASSNSEKAEGSEKVHEIGPTPSTGYTVPLYPSLRLLNPQTHGYTLQLVPHSNQMPPTENIVGSSHGNTIPYCATDNGSVGESRKINTDTEASKNPSEKERKNDKTKSGLKNEKN